MPTPEPSGETPFLSVVIPAYNERPRLPETLRKVESYLARQGYDWELIVVDDGSEDGTAALADHTFTSPRSRVLKNPRNLGKGASVRNGMLAARGRYRLFSDADLSTPIEELEKLLTAIAGDGSDVVIGSRAVRELVEEHQPIYRESMGRVFNVLVQAIVLRGIRDTQCGFKLFRAAAAEDIFPYQRTAGWAFDVEILGIARRRGHRIAEVPVRWLNSPVSRVRIVRDSLRMLFDLFRIRRHLASVPRKPTRTS
jgi:dolichyl-phosphate beta-glucosyltransferase